MRGAEVDTEVELGGDDRHRVLPARGLAGDRVRAAARPRDLIDGVAPAIVEPLAVQNVTTRPERAARDALREQPAAPRRVRRDPAALRRRVAVPRRSRAGRGLPERRRGRGARRQRAATCSGVYAGRRTRCPSGSARSSTSTDRAPTAPRCSLPPRRRPAAARPVGRDQARADLEPRRRARPASR